MNSANGVFFGVKKWMFFLSSIMFYTVSFAQKVDSTLVFPASDSLVTTHVDSTEIHLNKHGVMSYYSSSMNGHRTASGKRYYSDSLFAAHRSLPFGTRVLVHNPKTHTKVVVTIVDRMSAKGRVLDLSFSAAKQLGIIRQGIADLEYEVLH